MKNDLLEIWDGLSGILIFLFNISIRIGGVVLLAYALRAFIQFLIH